MIEQQEIDAWAERFGVGAAQIRRDHFVSHILVALSHAHPDLRFYGGTALCRTYLDGTRLSEDLDLLHPEPRSLLDAIKAGVPRGLRHEYPDATWDDEGAEGDGVVAFLTSPGVQAIKIYVGHDGPNTAAWLFVLTDVQLRYSDTPATAPFSCPTKETFAAMKLSAWYDRHAPRDLYDLAGLADDPSLDVAEVESLLQQKLGHGFIEAELARVPRVVATSWEAELGAQVSTLLPAEECVARAAPMFGRAGDPSS